MHALPAHTAPQTRLRLAGPLSPGGDGFPAHGWDHSLAWALPRARLDCPPPRPAEAALSRTAGTALRLSRLAGLLRLVRKRM